MICSGVCHLLPIADLPVAATRSRILISAPVSFQGDTLNPLTSFIGNIQYDDVSRVMGFFARARWIVRPGSEVFLVWTHNWLNEPELPGSSGFTTLSRGGALKANYSYRF